MSMLHEDVTSTTFTLLATTLSSAWKRTRTTLTFRATTLNPAWRRDLYGPLSFNYDPPLASNLLVKETVRPFSRFGQIQRYSPKR